MKANTTDDKTTALKNCFISWFPLIIDWVKLNVDGSMISEMSSIVAGGVVRDHRKTWLIDFALKIGTGFVLEVELWGILEGLKLVWQQGLRKVIIESYSKSTMELLSNIVPSCHPSP